MAATTVETSLFDDPTRPRRVPAGPTIETVEFNIPTTQLGDANDRTKLIPVPSHVRILSVMAEWEVLDSGAALVANLVINDDDGDTTIFGGAGFQSASSATQVEILDHAVAAPKGDASIDFVVSTAAATPAAGDIRVTAIWVGQG